MRRSGPCGRCAGCLGRAGRKVVTVVSTGGPGGTRRPQVRIISPGSEVVGGTTSGGPPIIARHVEGLVNILRFTFTVLKHFVESLISERLYTIFLEIMVIYVMNNQLHMTLVKPQTNILFNAKNM